MRVAGAVDESCARFGTHGLFESEADPVVAQDPGAVIVKTGGLEAGLHGEQVADGYLLFAGVVFIVQQVAVIVGNRLVEAINEATIDGNADKRRHPGFRHRFDVGGLPGIGAVEVLLDEKLAVVADEQAVQARHALRFSDRTGEKHVVSTRFIRCGRTRHHCEQQADEGV